VALIVLAIAFVAVGCGGSDSKEKSTADIKADVADLSSKYKCSTNPTDACGASVCAYLNSFSTYETAYAKVAWYKDYLTCLVSYLDCFEGFCTPGGTVTNAQSFAGCATNYLKCICGIADLKTAMGSAASQICK